MGDKDFEISGKHFKLSKISALKQFQIVRRVAPILGEMVPLMKDVAISKDQSEDQKLDSVAKMLSPMLMGLGKMKDEDADKLLVLLLQSVEIKQEATNSWARLANDQVIMFEDLGLPILLQCAGRAFVYNLGDFFAILPQVS